MSTYVDYRKKYADRRDAYIEIASGEEYEQATSKFLAFLKSFSISMNIDRQEELLSDTNDMTIKKDKNLSFTYAFAIDIPCDNINESIEKRTEIDRVIKYAQPTVDKRSYQYVFKGIKVLFKNLINNGTGVTNVFDHGLRCVVQDINVDYNADFGFFDGKGIHAKVYSISFNLNVLISNEGGNKYVCLGYNKKGEFHPSDVKQWPFFLPPFKRMNLVTNGANEFEIKYADKRNAYLTFSYGGKSAKFFAFVEGFSESNSFEFAETKLGVSIYSPEFVRQLGYKFVLNVPANDKSQAKTNMKTVQHLLRILAPVKGFSGNSKTIGVNLPGLLPNLSLYVDSVSINFDVDMGFFDGDFLYFKNFSIDFATQSLIKEIIQAEPVEEEAEEEEIDASGAPEENLNATGPATNPSTKPTDAGDTSGQPTPVVKPSKNNPQKVTPTLSSDNF
jgi:hypothetical protein